MKKHAISKLVLKKQTLKTLSPSQLNGAAGGYFIDSHITCDMGCVYWSIFTR